MEKAQATIAVNIGDMCVSVVSPNGEITTHVRNRYRDFLSNRSPDFEIVVAFLESGSEDPAEFLDVPNDLLQEFSERNSAILRDLEGPDSSSPRGPFSRGGEDGWFQVPSSATEPGVDPPSYSKPQVRYLAGRRILLYRADFAGCLDLRAGQGKAIFRRAMETTAVESFLRICYSFLAVEHEGLLLHSAGVLRNGNGYIFPGQSGTRKSTIASLATGTETILSDEMVVVRKVGGSHRLYSTPFYGTNESAERNLGTDLNAVFFPVKDDQVYLKEARPAQALSLLLASVLFFAQEPATAHRLMDICSDVVARVPTYEMHFRRDNSLWKCIDEIEKDGGP